MSEVLAQMRADLNERRSALMEAEKRLALSAQQIEQELREVRHYRQGLDQLLGQPQLKAVAADRVKPRSAAEQSQLLQAMLTKVLQAVHPQGLTSGELVERMQAEWPHGTLSGPRIGAVARVNPSLVNDGARWFWVPAEQAESGKDQG